MNLGGEPERDDFGLPPVDIEVPDDARELDRDVQAYRREQRALRRRQRRMRLGAPLTRDGVVLPLLASCLVLALIAGTLLTVFTAGPGGESSLPGALGTRTHSSAPAGNGPKASSRGSQGTTAGAGTGARTGAGSGGSPTAGPADSPTAAATAQRLPDKFIKFRGKPLALSSLLSHHTAVVLALFPAACQCQTTLRRLVTQVHQAGLRIYLVGSRGRLTAVQLLAAHLSAKAIVTEDTSDVLYKAYPPTGLTALLVQPDGTVRKAPALSGAFRLTSQLNQLNSEEAKAEAPPSAAASNPAATPSSPAAPSPSSPAPTSSP